jgi:exopolysaccharide production protein ExoQ
MMAGRIARAYVVLALSTLCALGYLVGAQEQQLNVASLVLTSGKGDQAQQTALLVIYAVGAVLLLLQVPLRRLLFLGLPLLLLLAWCMASITWSVNPDGTLRRVAALLGTVIIGAYAGIRFDLREMIRLLTYVAAILLIGSLMVGLLDPRAGLDPETRLRGVFHHKNSLGSFSAIALFTLFIRLIIRMDQDTPTRMMLGVLFVLCIFCLALSQSAGPVPSLLVMSLVLWVIRASQMSDGRFRAVLPLVVPAAAMSTAVLIAVVPGAAVFGRDSDLSGRTDIWQFAAMMIGQQPWTGYGFGVFWLGANAPAAPFWKATYNFVPNAHNGFLELGLDVGLFGIALLAAALIGLWVKTGRLLRHSRDVCLYWVWGFILFFCFVNLGEVYGWAGNSLFTILFVYLVVRINVEYAGYRARARSRRASNAELGAVGSGSFAS